MKKITLTGIFAAYLLITCHLSAEDAISGLLKTKDNVTISYKQYKNGSDTVIIICPGYANCSANRWMLKTVEILSPNYDVISIDFRGTGASSGTYTWSAKESMDVDAVLDYARSQGYRHIGIVGFSLGAAAAVNSVAFRDDIESMVLISCPTSFRMIDFHFWEPGFFSELKDNIECNWEGKGARATNIFMPKKDPVDTIKMIKHAAILFIAGDSDWVVKARHSKKLYAAASEPKKLVIIKGGGHAEFLIKKDPQGLADLITDWFARTIKENIRQ